MTLSYRLFHYTPQLVIQHPLTAVLVASTHAAFFAYLALSALDVGRGLSVAALNYSISARFQLVFVSRERGVVVAFDSASGELSTRPLPEEMR